jgi:hypothetical protein
VTNEHKKNHKGILGDAMKGREKKSAGFLGVIESRRDETGEGFRIGNLRQQASSPSLIAGTGF